jgi:gamma-glutamyltranspeptidase/glutathione hydrolase
MLVERVDLGKTLPEAVAVGRASQMNGTTSAEAAFIAAEGPGLAPFGHNSTNMSSTSEIGAAAALEFLPAGGVIAAAEPVRRGGGSAMVENPS